MESETIKNYIKLLKIKKEEIVNKLNTISKSQESNDYSTFQSKFENESKLTE